MRQMTMVVALLIGSAFVSTCSADEPKKPDAKPETQLVGSWTLVSAKYGGQDVKFPEGSSRVKHVTSTHFMWAIYDKDGKLMAALGGSYTMTGNNYEELPEYGSDEVLGLKGKAQTFEWKVDGNKWYHNGKLSSGLTIEEVWERIPKK